MKAQHLPVHSGTTLMDRPQVFKPLVGEQGGDCQAASELFPLCVMSKGFN